jgi:hypothetical protein
MIKNFLFKAHKIQVDTILEEGEIARACIKCGGGKKCIQILVEKPEGNSLLEDLDNIVT